MPEDLANSGEGGLPSRAVRKRRRAGRPSARDRRPLSGPSPTTGRVRARSSPALTALWILIVLVGGAIVTVVELTWRATGDPLQWYGAVGYVGVLVLTLLCAFVRRRRATATAAADRGAPLTADPVRAKPVVPRAVPEAAISDDAGDAGEASDDPVPLAFDLEKLSELRRAIAAAFPELAGEDADPRDEKAAESRSADTSRG